jgi:uridine kinase
MIVIGIAGGTGSGKTTVVRKIMENCPVPEVVVIPQDNYYRDNSHIPLQDRKEINFDHPASVEWPLLVEHIRILREGKNILMPTYSYHTCERQKETIEIHPAPIVIVEGILIFSMPEVRHIFDIKVFVDAEADDRLIRVIERDMLERGRDVAQVIDRYHKTVKPSHIQFIEPTKQFADIIVPQGGNNTVAIDILSRFIKQKISGNVKRN